MEHQLCPPLLPKSRASSRLDVRKLTEVKIALQAFLRATIQDLFIWTTWREKSVSTLSQVREPGTLTILSGARVEGTSTKYCGYTELRSRRYMTGATSFLAAGRLSLKQLILMNCDNEYWIRNAVLALQRMATESGSG